MICDQYGCHVMQRLVENTSVDIIDAEIGQIVKDNLMDIARHNYGNRVVQRILEYEKLHNISDIYVRRCFMAVQHSPQNNNTKL